MPCCISVLQRNKTNKMYMYMYIYVYVCIQTLFFIYRERERGRGRDTEGETERQRKTDIYYKGTGSHNYGGGKSQDLEDGSVSWRLRKAM